MCNKLVVLLCVKDGCIDGVIVVIDIFLMEVIVDVIFI